MIELKFAATINDNPVGQAAAFAPFLAALEEKMKRLLGRSVIFSLRLYKLRSWDSPAVARGDVDVQKISALTYVRLTQAGDGVLPLARGRGQSEAVFFARQKADISELRQVVGHSVAFAHTNSVVSFWGKVHLARIGICATNLKFYSNLVSPDRRPAGTKKSSSSPDPQEREIEDYAHWLVIEKVVSGEYDVGVAPSRHFESRRQRGGLVEVGRYAVPRDIFVARAGVPPEIVMAFRQALISLSDNRILRQLGSGTQDGLEAASDGDVDEIRKALISELQCFERAPLPSNGEAGH